MRSTFITNKKLGSFFTPECTVELNLDGVLGSGSIPSEIGLLANLTQLGLQGQIGLGGNYDTIRQGFSGSIPSEIGMLSMLGTCHKPSFSCPISHADLTKLYC
jgi:hypothetical protein